MKHYTMATAGREVGKSKSWKVAKRVSIKKWKEISKFGAKHYDLESPCGFCFVKRNRAFSCNQCFAWRICIKDFKNPKQILSLIRKLKV